ncbi:GNAT family N-acetyltransferase [Micropruina sp.]|uniref:GNAT family N-acetyltransferase n=1 Tax=Micropruina sp. TaxID=2737536 RepID=UPI0039E58DF9
MENNYGAFARISWPVRTARLSLRPAEPSDAEATWEWRGLPEVNRWLSAAPTRNEYLRSFPSPERLACTLIVELDGVPIGDLMLRVSDAWAQAEVAVQAHGVQAELGWTLNPSEQGHGYATEAVRAAITLCFDQLGIRRLEASCFAANEPSWRLMERLGMRRELYSVAESLHRELGWLDGMTYALLADEWHDAEHQE